MAPPLFEAAALFGFDAVGVALSHVVADDAIGAGVAVSGHCGQEGLGVGAGSGGQGADRSCDDAAAAGFLGCSDQAPYFVGT
ncbi:hypothetical protein [Mycobacteroides abscessus]|uniref:hypothetical protein n=1 Tax=Mycobacteroides abscessus TaxID=36809 RepID=UPI0009451BDF|nr:hypothetical protein [Mycobacteroides abscessus]